VPVIKRYPNRKLYDTTAKRYVTLDGIAGLVREGQEILVLEHTTGDDLTTLVLTQIICEQERKPGGYLPRTLLIGLIQAGEEALSALQVLGDAAARHAVMRRRVPTRDEFQDVLNQVDELSAKLDALVAPPECAPAATAESNSATSEPSALPAKR
jgi:polyhydroxyalkanoate synthesis repressor PhaR